MLGSLCRYQSETFLDRPIILSRLALIYNQKKKERKKMNWLSDGGSEWVNEGVIWGNAKG